MRILLTAALAALIAAPALADETSGHVLAFDRTDRILVLTDMTVWTLPEEIMVPADLGAGDRINVTFTSEGEDGVRAIDALDRVAIALPKGTDGGS